MHHLVCVLNMICHRVFQEVFYLVKFAYATMVSLWSTNGINCMERPWFLLYETMVTWRNFRSYLGDLFRMRPWFHSTF